MSEVRREDHLSSRRERGDGIDCGMIVASRRDGDDGAIGTAVTMLGQHVHEKAKMESSRRTEAQANTMGGTVVNGQDVRPRDAS